MKRKLILITLFIHLLAISSLSLASDLFLEKKEKSNKNNNIEVDINLDYLTQKSETLSLVHVDNTVHHFKVHKHYVDNLGSLIIRANENLPDTVNRLSLVVLDGVVSGKVIIDDVIYSIDYDDKTNSYTLEKENFDDPPGHGEPIQLPEKEGNILETSERSVTSNATAFPVIRVLVVYTPKAASSVSNKIAHASSQISDANEVFENSGLSNVSIEAAHVAVYNNYPINSNISSRHLDYIETSSFIDSLRNQYKADLVTLMVSKSESSGDNVCGRANLNADESSAFSVVRTSCIDYTFVHEIGHNLGAAHNPADAKSVAYPYAKGYRNPSGKYRTIMSIDTKSYCCTRIPYWSSSTRTYNGLPLGEPDIHDNERLMKIRASIVSQFKPPYTEDIPSLSVRSEFCMGRGSASWSTVEGATSYKLLVSPYSSMAYSVTTYSGTNTYYRYSIPRNSYLAVRACNSDGCGELSNPKYARYYPTCL